MAKEATKQRQSAPWVLVVDDERLAARATARAVSASSGVRVAVVGSVDAALHLVRRAVEPPAAVLLDFDLENGETGLTVLLSLRAAGCEAPCAFHTGAPDRARAALRNARLGDDYRVFDKGVTTADGFAEWTARTVRAGAGSHASGVRRRLV